MQRPPARATTGRSTSGPSQKRIWLAGGQEPPKDGQEQGSAKRRLAPTASVMGDFRAPNCHAAVVSSLLESKALLAGVNMPALIESVYRKMGVANYNFSFVIQL